MPSKLRIDQVNYIGKRVLMRVDYDVPFKDGKIVDNHRIVSSLESINYVLKNYCQAVILISHLGNPNGERDEKYSLKPVHQELQKLLKRKVIFLDDCVGATVEMAVMEPREGSVFLLENAQFHIEEIGETDDGKTASINMVVEFRRSLRRLAEVFVNDAFAFSHLKHSSMLGVGYEVRVAGFAVIKELKYLHESLIQPERPFLAIIGGNITDSRLALIDALLLKANEMIIAGGVAFTFLKFAENMEIGDSEFDERAAREVAEIMKIAKERKVQIHFPDDFVTAHDVNDTPDKCSNAHREKGIKRGYKGLDIGPRSLEKFAKIIRRAKILLWNGPVGAYDYPNFAKGTKDMVDLVVDQTVAHGVTIISGDSTIMAFKQTDNVDRVTYISHGNDAITELLKGERLPGIDGLLDEDIYCRGMCNLSLVIRPQIEDNPFGAADLQKIKDERRKKREEWARRVEEARKRKERTDQDKGPALLINNKECDALSATGSRTASCKGSAAGSRAASQEEIGATESQAEKEKSPDVGT